MKNIHIYFGLIQFFFVSAFCAFGQTPDIDPFDGKSIDDPQLSASPQEPKSVLERPTVWGEPTVLKILMYIIDVDEINSAEQNFTASVWVEAHWNIPALKHEGPGPLIKSWSEVWTSHLVIVNQQQGWRSFPETVEIFPDGEVVYRQKTWGKFSQPFNLRDFPLDRQKLTIYYAAPGLLENELKMLPLMKKAGRKSGIADTFSLPDFEVVSWKAVSKPYSPFPGELGVAGYKMEIEVQRRIAYYIVKIIIPLCLIVIMSWVPLWTDPRQIGSNLAISATSFLTLVAYLFAIAVLLPKVSYLTRMDVFIILSTIMVFACLIQTVAMTNMVIRDKVKQLDHFLKWSRVIYPILLIFVIAYSFWL